MENILPNTESPFKNSTEKYLELMEYLQSATTFSMTGSRLEQTLSGEGRELMRRLTQGTFYQTRIWRYMGINSWF